MQPILFIKCDTTLKCSDALLESSSLLKDMTMFCEPENDPIPLPKFIKDDLIINIMELLDKNKLGDLQNLEIEYLIHLVRASDFLGIAQLTKELMLSVINKVTHINCFKIFRKTNRSYCYQEITDVCLLLMISQMNSFYQNLITQQNNQDPFSEQYIHMHIDEITMIITHLNSASTLTKIIILKKWWYQHKYLKFKERILKILQFINDTATYIPRSQIVFMRRIRDTLIQDIKNMEKNISYCDEQKLSKHCAIL